MAEDRWRIRRCNSFPRLLPASLAGRTARRASQVEARLARLATQSLPPHASPLLASHHLTPVHVLAGLSPPPQPPPALTGSSTLKVSMSCAGMK